MEIQKHFVRFFSPGTFFTETTDKEIDSWDVDKAKEMAKTIKERYDAVPYGFYFITRGRGSQDLDSEIVNESPRYFLGGTHGRVLFFEQVKELYPSEKILLSNMENNNMTHVYETLEGWKTTVEFRKDDTLLN